MTFDGGQDEQNLQDASEPGEPRPASCPSCYPVQIQGLLILCSAGGHGCLAGRFHGGLGLSFEMHPQGRGAEHLAGGPVRGRCGWIPSFTLSFAWVRG
jgi:hypothetical protein